MKIVFDGSITTQTPLTYKLPQKSFDNVKLNGGELTQIENDIFVPIVTNGVIGHHMHFPANAIKGRFRSAGFKLIANTLLHSNAKISDKSAFILRQGSLPAEAGSIKDLTDPTNNLNDLYKDITHPQIAIFGAMSSGIKDFSSKLKIGYAVHPDSIHIETKTNGKGFTYTIINDPENKLYYDVTVRANPIFEDSFRSVVTSIDEKFLPGAKSTEKKQQKLAKENGEQVAESVAATNQRPLSKLSIPAGAELEHVMSIDIDNLDNLQDQLNVGWLLHSLVSSRREHSGASHTNNYGILKFKYSVRFEYENDEYELIKEHLGNLNVHDTSEINLLFINSPKLKECWDKVNEYKKFMKSNPQLFNFDLPEDDKKSKKK